MVNRADATAQQEAISEALWRVMSRGGPQSVSMRAVAAEAGCTTGLVTSRFPTKQALLAHARRMLDERTAARMDEIESTVDDPVRALERVLEVSVLTDDFDARIWLGYLAATLSDRDLASVQVEANRKFVATVRRLVARLAPDAPGDQVLTAAVEVVATVTGVAALSTADPDTYSRERIRVVVERIVERARRGRLVG